MDDRPYLALCMIVRDAQDTLPRLLNSIRGAFNEYVFVDTGSEDRTREILYEFLRDEGKADRRSVYRINWIDDFAAARNFSYNRATARWRCYLDADDELPLKSPNQLRDTLRDIESRRPEVNSISVAYQYAENDTEQDVASRIVRWWEPDGSLVGWRWEDELHEHLTCKPKPRLISKVVDLKVVHHKTWEDMQRSYKRNNAIIDKVLADPNISQEKEAKFAFYKAQVESNNGNYEEAYALLDHCIKVFGETNLGAYAYADQVKILVEKGDLDKALDRAAVFAGRLPEFKQSHLWLGTVHALKEDWGRALETFNKAMTTPEMPVQSYDEVWFSKGWAPALEALSCAHEGKIEEGLQALDSIPNAIRMDRRVFETFSKANVLLMKKKGLQAYKAYTDYLLWDTEAYKALDTPLPAAISHLPEVAKIRRDIRKKCEFLSNWEKYKKAYSEIPTEDFCPTEDEATEAAILSSSRAQEIVGWANALPEEGPPIKMLSIGFNDGVIEKAVLNACPRIEMTVADVAPQSNQGLNRLEEIFGSRVKVHHVKKNHYDWFYAEEAFDAIMMFEVLEHLPSDWSAMSRLYALLRKEGRLFLSTPVAERWVEPYLTGPSGPSWYGHVRAHNHVSFHELSTVFFKGVTYEGFDGTFVLNAVKRAEFKDPQPSVAIVVPATPNPFDPTSHLKGFLGGSEECVVHLAPALAELGFDVTVYTPTPAGFPKIRTFDDVLWRDISEWDPGTEDHAYVLFWRSAHLIPPKGSVDYTSFLWLHDAYYGVPSSEYEKADVVLTISNSQERSIEKYDGFQGPFCQVRNGIDPQAFPDLGTDSLRKANSFIYASSPDRGLARVFDLWPGIQGGFPGATLDIYYDWSGYKAMFPREHDALLARMKALQEEYPDTIKYHGGVDHTTLHEAFRRASFWFYPNKGVVETFCITAVKAMASGCWPIVPDVGALQQVCDGTLLTAINDDNIDTPKGRAMLMEGVRQALQNPPTFRQRKHLRENALARFSWPQVARAFKTALTSRGKFSTPFP